jgi:hypothetical protein
MTHKGIEYKVTAGSPAAWRWAVFIDSANPRTGISLTRSDAVIDAEFAIEEAAETLSPVDGQK